jgi:Protein of unknown function (DUF3999)
MKSGALLLLILAFAASAPEPSLTYFSNVRDVNISQPDRQNFFVIDEEIWAHSRVDLGDLRLYDGDTSVQYSLSEQSAGVSSEEVEAKIFNLGSVSGHTEFDLDTDGLATYDRIRLRLDAKDFVVTASITGSNRLGQKPSSDVAPPTELAPSTLYDFTSEQLGSNFVLKLPPSSFRYLHIKLTGKILPQQVKGAAIFNLREQQASWAKAGSCLSPQQKQHLTVIVCHVPAKVPLNRIAFEVASAQVNFRRTVNVENDKGEQETSGDISRVRVNRAGTLVTSEDLAMNVAGIVGQIVLTLDNGENPPLAVVSVQPLSLERRIYFDPQGKTSLKLYYGDEKLASPIYDYARFFHLDDSPAQAQLGSGSHNPQYTGRPDERPWSDRHMGILWGVMILAVLALGSLAIRGFRSPA